ncbi:hypothetical protein L596_024138 [Steinernema carpocapsae]|uniref:Helicase POLQ-like n=1 Tax=Steinernema carpocapsae TaxID=34508 RepID=A0A4V5ZZM0_STECR|nr:hypothetical protein L596_024138 [Steinernema carpocapsae]
MAPVTTPLRRSNIPNRTVTSSGRILSCSPRTVQPFKSPFTSSSTSTTLKRSALEAVGPATPLREENGAVRRSLRLSKETEDARDVSKKRGDEDVEMKSQPLDTSPEIPSLGKMYISGDAPINGPFTFGELPENVRELYKEKRKIKDLYDWQKECLSDQRLLRGSNVIICLPTGAGKTLIAEVLMLRELLVRKKNCILVLPYVAIVQEKMTTLSAFEEDFEICVEQYAASVGRLPPIKRRKRNSIFVATIEKANMLVNSMIETGRMDSIGLVVVDEMHMLGEGGRGAVLEQLLAKYMFKGSGQIVGMSATLSNIEELAKYLKAYVYTTNFRPIELEERVKIGDVMYRVDPGGHLIHDKDLQPNPILAKRDPDGLVMLLQDVVPQKSVIIFCPSRQNCENVCRLISGLFPKSVRELHKEKREAVIRQIQEDSDGRICPVLESGLRYGIAYHHSGLTAEERKHVEAAFQDQIICIICATSTLAAGVNLPARRVIIKTPLVGRNPLGKAQYLQMIGRAGRAGFDDKGDCVTIVRDGAEERTFREMLLSPMLRCESSLGEESQMASFVLDLISMNLCKSMEDLQHVISGTLLGVQKEPKEVFAFLEKTVACLKNEKMIDEDQEHYKATTLGSATFNASIPPTAAQQINSDLTDNLEQGIVLSSHLHLLYTISPYEVAVDINWDLFHCEYVKLPQCEKDLLAKMRLPESRIFQHIVLRSKLETGDPVLRLYIALIMQKIWSQEPLWKVAEQFAVTRGWIQSTLQSTIAQASSVARFSEKVTSLWSLKQLLPDLVKKLSDCAKQELVPLLQIDCVKRGRAQQLYTAGYKNVNAIACANINDLMAKIEHLNAYQAKKMISSASTVIRDQIAEKEEELEALGLNLDVWSDPLVTNSRKKL